MSSLGSVRIIGGMWRGRKLTVPEIEGLRPTPDRVRETLFNWLMPVIQDTYCLDLFAGSGVLGFEALSRGAQQVEMVDQSAEVIEILKKEQSILGANNLTIRQCKVPHQLTPGAKSFDIVFLDPPYAQDSIIDCAHYLESNHFLADPAYIYLEDNKPINPVDLPANWHIIKSQRAGQVYYHLALREI